MTAGPPVTVVDPRGAAPPLHHDPPPLRSPWTRTERLLALVIAALVAVATAAASNLSSRPPEPSAVAVSSDVTLTGSVLLDLVLRGRVPARAEGYDVDEGWSVVMAPESLHDGVALVLAHDSVCTGLRPPSHVRILAGSGPDLPVHDAAKVLSCDPSEPLRVLSSSLTSGGSVTIEITVVNAAARTLRLTGFRYDGFRLDPVSPLPVAFDGRDGRRPLRLEDLVPHVVRLRASVSDCARAAASLASAVRTEQPDALPATVDGTPRSLPVKGLEVYLEQLRRATCVR